MDGRDLNAPGEVVGEAIRIPAGGRADLTLVMPPTAVALVVDDDIANAGLLLAPTGQPVSTPDSATSTREWPELDLRSYGESAATPFDATSVFDRRFTMVLDRGAARLNGSVGFAFTVNGRAFPNIPTQVVQEGDLVLLTVVNRSRDTHPMHLHGHTVLALSRNGLPFTGSPVWLDTYDVQPGEV